MQIVILAAGKGTRMKDLTKEVPKPMLKVAGRPILEHKLDKLPQKITEVIFIIGYLGEQIKDYFGDNYKGKKITYIEQKKLNGTGGAVHLVKNKVKDKFMVMMGDDLYAKEDIKRIIDYDLAILACEVEDPSQFGMIKIDENDNFRGIIEKPKGDSPTYAKASVGKKSNLVNTGLYVLNKKFFEYPLVKISETEYGLPQTLLKMAKDHSVTVLKTKKWKPIGSPKDLKNIVLTNF